MDERRIIAPNVWMRLPIGVEVMRLGPGIMPWTTHLKLHHPAERNAMCHISWDGTVTLTAGPEWRVWAV